MRRRRGTRSATPTTTTTPTPESPTQPSSSRSPPWVNAESSPWNFAGWPWDPVYLLTSLWGIILSFAGQTYWDIFVTGREMALGLGRWWAGAGVEEEVEMTESKRDGGVAKVKRRRRKEATSGDAPQYFPGMVNLSGTLCYMNSVLQAFASMASLISHLERIVALAVDVDIPTPVTDALLDVLQELNTPRSRQPPALRPLALLHALKALPAIQRLLGTREQQDAHELFVVLAEAVSDEAVKVAAEVARLKGFGEVLSLQGYASEKGLAKDQEKSNGNGRAAVMRVIGEERRKIRGLAQPWEGLMARRRVCRRCGWCEAIRMDTLGGMELPLPLHGDVTVDACIAEYLAPEHLTGVTCEMCSLRQTLAQYHAEAERLSAPPGAVPNGSTPTHRTSSGSFAALEDLPTSDGPQGVMTPSRKKRARDARRVETRLKEILDSGVITGFGDSTLPPGPSSSVPIPVKWQTARTDSIREAIVTRPPQSLRLHFIRSEYTPYGTLLKKTARVAFPMILDLTRFVARGIWEERAGVLGAIAAQGAAPPRRALYRLESAILHYGYTHSSGHFICIRRKPKPSPTSLPPLPPSDREGEDDQAEDGDGYSGYRPSTARKSCPDGCHCQSCVYFGQVRSAEGEQSVPGKGWLRISDADMEEVGEEALIEARGAVFMLFYERVGEYEGERVPVVPAAPVPAPQQQDGDISVKATELEA